MKKLITSLFLATILGSAFATQHVVQVSDYQYSPAQVNISPGDTVKFQWIGGGHPTTSDNGAFATFNMDITHQVHLLVFNAVGTYPYHCIPHQSMGMTGMITVSNVNSAPSFQKRTEVSVYPNPASDVIYVSHNLDRIDGVKITNMIGQQVRFIKPGVENAQLVQVSIADLPKGMYLVNLQSNGVTVFTKRIIKDR